MVDDAHAMALGSELSKGRIRAFQLVPASVVARMSPCPTSNVLSSRAPHALGDEHARSFNAPMLEGND